MFITLEGPDGSGKSTHINPLADYLQDQGYSVLITREPGGTEIGDQIRLILSDLKNTGMHSHSETLLFLAARAQLVHQVIKPHLKEGHIVLCDRYADSTMAYQGYGHRNDLEEIKILINFATGGLKPDLTLLLDMDVEEGLNRKAGGSEWNRLDAYSLEFHQRVRQGYHSLAKSEPERWVMIEAGGSEDEVQAALRRVVKDRLIAPVGS